MELVKDPVPVPSDVFVDKEIVGFGDVDQQTPLDVTVCPPLFVTLPPMFIIVPPINVGDDVDTIGSVDALVVN